MIPFITGQQVYDELARLGLAHNTFDDLVDHGRSLVASPIAIADEFEDAAGIDGANSTGETYNAAGYAHNDPSGTSSWSETLNDNDSGQADVSYRFVVPAADISTSGSDIQLRCAASTVGALSVDNVSIVERDGATANGAAAPTPVLFGGTAGFSIAAGQTVLSDITSYALDEAKDYLVIFDVSGADGNPRRRDGTGTTYVKAATDSHNVDVVAGFSADVRSYILSELIVDPVAPALDLWSIGVGMPSGPNSGFFVGHFSESDPDTIYCSNDDGVTWDEVTLTDYGDFGSGISVFAGPVALTGGGTDVRLRAVKAAETELRVQAWCGVFGNA